MLILSKNTLTETPRIMSDQISGPSSPVKLTHKIIHRKIPQTEWLTQQKFTFSWFWRLEVHNQSTSRVVFWWGLSPWLTDGHLLAVSSPIILSVWHTPDVSSSSYREHQSYCIRAPHFSHLTLVISLKTLSTNIVTLGVRALRQEFDRDITQSITGGKGGRETFIVCLFIPTGF